VAHQFLGLELVRGDHVGPGAHAGEHRVTFGVEQHGDAALAEVGHEAVVGVDVDARGQAARENADGGTAGEIVEALDEGIEFLRPDVGTALVDLGLLVGGRVDHGEVDPRLFGNPDEVGKQRFLGQLGQHTVTGRASGEAGRDHGPPQQAQRPGDVDALATRHGPALDRAVLVALAEVGNGDGPVHGRVECHRNDHCLLATLLSLLCRSASLRRLTTITTTASMANPTSRSNGHQVLTTARIRSARLGSAIAFAALRGTAAIRSPSTVTRAMPMRSPLLIGPSIYSRRFLLTLSLPSFPNPIRADLAASTFRSPSSNFTGRDVNGLPCLSGTSLV